MFFKRAAVAGQFRQHYREPYDLRRWQRVGNRCRMHGSDKMQVGIFAQRSVRLTLCLLRQIGVGVGCGMHSEISADEDGAESASDDGLLKGIEEPVVEDGTFVGVAQIVDGVVDLVVGEGVVGLVATDETPEGLVLQVIVGLADVGLEVGGVADVIVPDVVELLDELVGEIDEGGVDAAAFDEVDDGEEEHGFMRRFHSMDFGDVEGGEEFGESDDGWHGVVVLMGQRYGIYLTLPNVSAKKMKMDFIRMNCLMAVLTEEPKTSDESELSSAAFFPSVTLRVSS